MDDSNMQHLIDAETKRELYRINYDLGILRRRSWFMFFIPLIWIKLMFSPLTVKIKEQPVKEVAPAIDAVSLDCSVEKAPVAPKLREIMVDGEIYLVEMWYEASDPFTREVIKPRPCNADPLDQFVFNRIAGRLDKDLQYVEEEFFNEDFWQDDYLEK